MGTLTYVGYPEMFVHPTEPGFPRKKSWLINQRVVTECLPTEWQERPVRSLEREWETPCSAQIAAFATAVNLCHGWSDLEAVRPVILVERRTCGINSGSVAGCKQGLKSLSDNSEFSVLRGFAELPESGTTCEFLETLKVESPIPLPGPIRNTNQP
jgi:hypothetical protein